MRTVYIMKGLPASGKSTKAHDMVLNGNGNVKRVNKDDLRSMIDNNKWSKSKEKAVIRSRDALIKTWLQEGFDVIVDDTNLAPKHITRIQSIVDIYNEENKLVKADDKAHIEIIDLTAVSVYECIRRDKDRENSVGDKVIWQMYNQFIEPTKQIFPWSVDKENVYLCDLDGTIALHKGRDPYDYKNCINDVPNLPVTIVIKALVKAGEKVIFVTAREAIENTKELTEEWIRRELQIDNPIVVIRDLGDNRKDNITKREMYDNHIFPYYNVIGIFDDRKQVIDMWRDMGITVFDVAGHTF